MVMFEVPFEQVKYRISLKPPVSKYDTNEFWSLYTEKGYAALVERYIDNSLKSRLRFILKKIKHRLL
jgi:hypothetical protein